MRRRIELLILCLLVGAFAAQSWSAMSGDAQTSDEAVHLAAGVAHLRLGDRRMNPEHPPLAKLISAVPFLFVDAPLPTDSPAWTAGEEWSFGARFLYRNRLSPDEILFWGRLPILMSGVLLILLIYFWARRLHGVQGALIATAVAAFEPNLIAHSHYVTNDLLLALLFGSTLFVCTRMKNGAPLARLVAAGLGTGMTLGTKYSGLLLLPLVPLFLWPSPQQDRSSRKARVRQTVRRTAIVAGVAYVTLAAIYQAEPVTAYWQGLHSMQSTWAAFLLGDISSQGWYHYFLVAILVKTPPGTLLLVGLALVTMRRARPAREEVLILVAALWFLVCSSLLRINIGLRHVLPIYPLALVLAGRVATAWRDARWIRPAALGAVATAAVEVAACHPFYLSYFSSAVGGPWEGYRYLSDSNLDWGQDLKRLARWSRRENLDGLLLGVFSGADPEAYGLRFMPVPGFGAVTYRERPWSSLPPRVVLAMSAMNLQGVYFALPGLFHTRLPIDQTLYRFLLEKPPLTRLTPAIWTWDLTHDPVSLYRLGAIYLNFGWNRSAVLILNRYLELRPDDERARAGLARVEQAMKEQGRPSPGGEGLSRPGESRDPGVFEETHP